MSLSRYRAYLQSELKLVIKKPAVMVESLIFFVIVTSLFPIAIEPDAGILQKMAPGVVLIALVFVVMLQSQMQLFQEFEEGAIEQLIISPCSLPCIVLAKVLSLSLSLFIPLALVLPIMSYAFGVVGCGIAWVGVLLLVIPIVVFISYLGSSLTLGLKQENILLSVLVLPLLVPVLIFAAGAMQALMYSIEAAIAPICVLAALFALCFGFLPHAIAGILRFSHA